MNEKKRVSVVDASKELSVPKVVIEEWMNFLEEKGVIDVNYKLTTAYLVRKGITKKDIEKKTLEFKGHREGFLRKIESTVSVIERETAGLKNLKQSFDELSKDVEDFEKFASEQKARMEKFESGVSNKIDMFSVEKENLRRDFSSISNDFKNIGSRLDSLREKDSDLNQRLQNTSLE